MFSRPPSMPKPHLYFVLSELTSSNEVVAVMLVTARSYTDPTLELDVGAHPFIERKSAVTYSTANFYRERALLHHGTLKSDMTDSLLKEVRLGLLRSPYTVRRIRGICEALWEAELSSS